jgi:hypothetical protein
MLIATQEKYLNTFKLSGAVSSVLGGYVLFNFFVENKLPIPHDMQFLLAILPIIAAVATIGIILSAAGLLLPATWLRWMNFDLNLLIKGKSSDGSLIIFCMARNTTSFIYLRRFFRYFLYHGGLAAALIVLEICSMLFGSDDLEWYVLIPVFSYIALIVLKVARTAWDVSIYKILLNLLFTNAIFLLWYVFICLISQRSIEKSFHTENSLWIFLGVSLLMLLFHFIQVTALASPRANFTDTEMRDKDNKRYFLGIVFIPAISLLHPIIAAEFGMFALNMLGLGGYQPVRIELNQSDDPDIPSWTKQKDLTGQSPVIYMAFEGISSIYIAQTRDKHTGLSLPMHSIRKIDFLSNKLEVIFTQIVAPERS